MRGKIITHTQNNTSISLSLQGDIMAVNKRLDKMFVFDVYSCKLTTPN